MQELAGILPKDRDVRWQVYVPTGTKASGLLVFISPGESGAPPREWLEVLERENLIWIGADRFGNEHPVRQRMLAALMGLSFARQHYAVDAARVYVGGMSGGGRVASATVTKFPHLFRGALYIVGVNFWTPSETKLLGSIAANRYVFITGTRDFNRSDTRHVYKQYRAAGVEQVLLMDLPHFGHQLPDAEQFAKALQFLDGDTAAQPPQ